MVSYNFFLKKKLNTAVWGLDYAEGISDCPIGAAEGAENGLEFTIVRPFNWIGPRMDFIPGIDGPSEGVPRVLACFSNVSLILWPVNSHM